MIKQPAWFSEEGYYKEKLIQVEALGYSATLEGVKEAVDGVGGPWAHYMLYGYKELHPHKFFFQYLPLGNDYNRSVFSEYDYGWSKVWQLRALNVPGFDSTTSDSWREVLERITDTGMSTYEHYVRHGQAEGLDVNGGFNSRKFFEAKLLYLNSDTEKWGTWTMDNLVKCFVDNELDAYSNWLESGEAEGITFEMVRSEAYDDNPGSFDISPGHDEVVGTSEWGYFVTSGDGDPANLERSALIDCGGGSDYVVVAKYSYNSIIGGRGGDYIQLGAREENTNNGNNVSGHPEAYDRLFQGLGDSGVLSGAKISVPTQAVNCIGFDRIYNFDVAQGDIPGDRLHITSYTGANKNFTGVFAKVALEDMATGVDNGASWVFGTFTGSAFAYDAKGDDMLLVYDADSRAGVISWEAVVLAGVGSGAVAVAHDDRINGDYITIA